MLRCARQVVRASCALTLAIPAARGQAAPKNKSTPETKAPPALALVEDLRITLPDARAQRGSSLLVGPDGRMVAMPQWGGDMTVFDSAGKQLPYKQTIGGPTDPEIRYVSTAGWVGKMTWIHDPQSSQIALVD